jgi:RND family efflux transporter MFP subunit
VKYLQLVLVAALVAACSDGAGELAGDALERVTRVVVEKPMRHDVKYVLSALGTVESIHNPTLSAETMGQVQEIAVREGDTVATGQLLVALDGTLHAIETAKAEAELRRADVLLDNQQKEVKRLRRLDESQSVSRDKLEDEQAQMEMLRAQRDVAKKQWEQANYLESKTRIEAPLAGLITRRHVSPGDYVTSGQPLFELVSVDVLRARIAFPERDASRISIGKQVHLSTPAAPGVLAVGEVSAVNPQINMENRAIEITVEFENPGGWLPGASVDATLVVEERPGAVAVPLLAIANRNGRKVVFRSDSGLAVETPVQLGWREDDWVEVLSGLSFEDDVVVEGAAMIADGSRIEAVMGAR